MYFNFFLQNVTSVKTLEEVRDTLFFKAVIVKHLFQSHLKAKSFERSLNGSKYLSPSARSLLYSPPKKGLHWAGFLMKAFRPLT